MSLTIIRINKVINLLLLGNHLPCLTFIKKHKSRGRNKVVCCIPKVDILILSVGILKTNLKLHKYSSSTVHSKGCFEKVHPHLEILLEALIQQDQSGHVNAISRPQHTGCPQKNVPMFQTAITLSKLAL